MEDRVLLREVGEGFRSVSPELGESVHSYMHRLAREYGVVSVHTIHKDVGVGGPRLFSELCIPRLAELGGVTMDAVASLCGFDPAYAAGQSIWRFGLEETSHFPGVNCRALPVCPECLRQRGIVPAFVHLAAVVACPLHGCMLVGSCPSCLSQLRIDRPRLSHCKCRAALDNIDPTPAADAELALAASIYSRMTGHTTIEVRLAFEGRQINLAALSLDDLVYLHWSLGHVLPNPQPVGLGSRRHLTQEESIAAARRCIRLVETPEEIVSHLRAWLRMFSDRCGGEVSLPLGLFRGVLKRLIGMRGIPTISQLISYELESMSRRHRFRPSVGPRPPAQLNLFEDYQ